MIRLTPHEGWQVFACQPFFISEPIMKTNSLLLSLVLGGVIALAAGCGKNEPAPPPAAETHPAEKKLGEAAATLKQEAQKAAAAAKAQTQQAAEAAKAVAAQAREVVSQTTDTAKAQALIDAAKNAIAANKWQDAARALNELTNLKLTAEQQAQLLEIKTRLEQMVQAALKSGTPPKAGTPLGETVPPKK